MADRAQHETDERMGSDSDGGADLDDEDDEGSDIERVVKVEDTSPASRWGE